MTQTQHQTGFLTRATDLAQRVRQAFRRLLVAVPGAVTDRRGRRTIPGLNATLQSRLVRALDQHEPLSILHHLPGIAGLRSVIDEAARRGTDPDLLADARTVTAELAEFFDHEGLDRETLQAMLASDVPEARDAMVRTNSQMLYKSLSNLKGYAAESLAMIAVAYPGDDPAACTVSMVGLIHGLRRFRADAQHYERGYVTPKQEGKKAKEHQYTLDGVPLSELDGPPIVDELTSDPRPCFEPELTPLGLAHRLVEHEVGRDGTMSYAVGMTVTAAKPRVQTEEYTTAIMSAVSTLASKRFVLDVLVHDDIWPGVNPVAETYSIVPHGPVTELTRLHRAADRLNLGVSAVPLGRGAISFEHAVIPKHRRALDHLLESTGMDASTLRGYRLDMQYPLFGVQYGQVFELPESP